MPDTYRKVNGLRILKSDGVVQFGLATLDWMTRPRHSVTDYPEQEAPLRSSVNKSGFGLAKTVAVLISWY